MMHVKGRNDELAPRAPMFLKLNTSNKIEICSEHYLPFLLLLLREKLK